MQAPWTEIGRIQGDVCSIRNEMRNKPDSHEVTSLSRRMDSMEHSIRDIRSILDELISWKRDEIDRKQRGAENNP